MNGLVYIFSGYAELLGSFESVNVEIRVIVNKNHKCELVFASNDKVNCLLMFYPIGQEVYIVVRYSGGRPLCCKETD